MDSKTMAKRAQSRNIGTEGKSDGYERHVLVCTGKSCCGDKNKGVETFKFLNKRLSKLKKEGRRFRCSEVSCLSICSGGPLVIVYPEGTWYHSVTPEVCARIIDEHLLEGHIVEEFAFAHNPLVQKCE